MRRKSSLPPGAKLGALALAILAGALWFSCSSETLDAPSSPEPLGGLAAAAGPPDLARALAAQERHTAALMRIPGVVGTAVGLAADGPAVRIFLSHADVAGIPARLDDVPVAAEVTGLFWAGTTTRERPAPLGFSIGHPDITAGTLGARVVDSSGNLYILSNNHVIANSNNASIGDPTLQPGPFDGGSSADSLAWLADFQVINFGSSNNTLDAAVARTVADNVSASTPAEAYGAPSSQIFGDANNDGTFDDVGNLLGLTVMKFGRTTELTSGDISEINLTVTVCYAGFGPFCTQSATFTDQIAIGSGTFSDGGDSGSLIVSQSGKNPVGLLFAGSSTRTIANRIDFVLDRFNVSVDDGSGGGGGGGGGNNPPTASFTFSCTDLSCSFDGSGSSDSDGTIQSYAWNFGDGSNGSGVTVDHTYAAAGTYTVTLTVTDDDGASDSDAQDVTVSSGGGGGTTMHVGDLDGSNVNNGSTWTANVTITVHDEGHGALSSASVSGTWSNGTTGSASCTTNGSGTCTVSKSGIPKRVGSVRFTVGNVTHASLTYDSGANHDPDGSSDGTAITVSKP